MDEFKLTTIHPNLKNMTTPRRLIKQEVNTPSQVPNNTGSRIKKLDFHHTFCDRFWGKRKKSVDGQYNIP